MSKSNQQLELDQELKTHKRKRDPDDVPDPPSQNSQKKPSNSSSSSSSSSTPICHFYQKGNCANEHCKFRHEDSSDYYEEESSSYMPICHFYQMGTCANRHCKFRHEDEYEYYQEPEPPPPRRIPKAFQNMNMNMNMNNNDNYKFANDRNNNIFNIKTNNNRKVDIDVGFKSGISAWMDDGPNKLFINNLPRNLTSNDVIELLQAIGPLKAFHLVVDPTAPPDQHSKGYGFCEYKDPANTTVACKGLNGMDLGERKNLCVKVAVPRNERMNPQEEARMLSAHISNMKNRGNVNGVLDIYVQNRKSLNHIHFSNIFGTFGKSQNPREVAARLAKDERFPLLMNDTCEKMKQAEFFDVQALAIITHSLGKMKMKNEDTNGFFSLVENHTEMIVRDANVLELSNITWAFASADFRSDRLFDAIAGQRERIARDGDVQYMANICWAFATNGHKHDLLFDAVAGQADRIKRSENDQDYNNIVWAFATTNHKSEVFREGGY